MTTHAIVRYSAASESSRCGDFGSKVTPTCHYPGLGVLHADTDARDSLACDLMEPIRPHVDAFVLNWLARQPFRREWFFEQRNGNCRLMAVFSERLSQTASTWAQAVAPVAERVVKTLWSTT